MKKIIVLALALVMVLTLAACGANSENETEQPADTAEAPATTETPATAETPDTAEAPADTEESNGVMTYKEYACANVDDAVVIEGYVQAKQSWWDNKATVYLADRDGAYFAYNMTCTEEDYAKLTDGTKIRVTGYKAEWAGEVEIAEGATFEFVDGADTFVAEPVDVTDLAGKAGLIEKMNQRVVFKGLTVEAYDETGAAFAYKNAEEKTDDLYFKAAIDGATVNFCVEFYLTGADTEVYKAVEGLKVGDVIDVEGFLYWYEGANPQVTSITVVG